MATYFINANGSATAPYDTPEKGHISLGALLAAVTEQNGDIIEVVNDGIITETLAIDTNSNLTVRSYAANTSKPEIKMYGSAAWFRGQFTLQKIKWDVGGGEFYIQKTCILDRNIFHNITSTGPFVFSSIAANNLNGSVIKNNVFYDVRRKVISLGSLSYSSSNIKIYNNSFWNFNKDGNSNAMAIKCVNIDTLDVRNNIVDGNANVNTKGIEIESCTNVIQDYNNVWNCAIPYVGTSQGANNPDADPQFVNPGTDFSLQLTSPCLNSGALLAEVTEDNEGVARPQGPSYDMGALEYLADVIPPDWENSTPELKNQVSDGADVDVQINESGKVYMVVVLDGETAPTPAEVKAGQKSGGNPAVFAENVTVSQGVTSTINLTGFSPVGYDLYFVAEDLFDNLQAAVTKLDMDLDAVPPVISVIGDDPLAWPKDVPFVEPGAIAVDAVDGDLTGDIVYSGTVDITAPGDYVLNYEVEDSSQNSISATRTVSVYVPTPTPNPIRMEQISFQSHIGMDVDVPSIDMDSYTDILLDALNDITAHAQNDATVEADNELTLKVGNTQLELDAENVTLTLPNNTSKFLISTGTEPEYGDVEILGNLTIRGDMNVVDAATSYNIDMLNIGDEPKYDQPESDIVNVYGFLNVKSQSIDIDVDSGAGLFDLDVSAEIELTAPLIDIDCTNMDIVCTSNYTLNTTSTIDIDCTTYDVNASLLANFNAGEYLLNGGKVGIGTNAINAATLVHIYGGNLLLENDTQYMMKDGSGNVRNVCKVTTDSDLITGDSQLRDYIVNVAGLYDALVIKGTTGYAGIGVADPQERFDVAGGIRVGNTTSTNAGTVRWTGADFEGHNGTQWLSLTDVESMWVGFGGGIYYASGNVGIGTTSTTETCEILGTLKLQNGTAVNEFSVDGTFSGDSDNALVTEKAIKSYVDTVVLAVSGTSPWLPNGSDLYYNVGKVGVGIASPLEMMDVNGGLRVGTSSGTNAGTIRWSGTDFEGYNGSSWQSFTQASMWGLNGSKVYYNGGNLGLGTNDPSATMEIVGTLLLQSGTSINEFSVDGLLAGNSDNSVPTEQAVKTYTDAQISALNASLPWLKNGTDIYYSSGQVGIGVASPVESLEVSGAVKVGDATGTTAGTIRWSGTDFEGYNGSSWQSFTQSGIWGINGSKIYYNVSNVGIGSSDPSATLEVVGTLLLQSGTSINEFSVDGLLAGNSDNSVPTEQAVKTYTDTQISTLSASRPWLFNGSDIHYSSGNVGMGVASPVENLEVDGAIRLGTTTNTNSGTIRWTGSDFEGYTGSTWESFTLASLWGKTGDVLHYTAGAIGIGTTNPSAVLELSDDNARIAFDQTNAGALRKWWIGTSISPNGFGLYDATGIGWRVFVDTVGNVGINTQTPVEKLEIVDGGIRIANSNNTNAGTMRWSGSDFEGYNGSAWKSLTQSPGVWQETASFGGGIYYTAGWTGIGTNAPAAGSEITIDSSTELFLNSVTKTNVNSDSEVEINAPSLDVNCNTTTGWVLMDANNIQLTATTLIDLVSSYDITLNPTNEVEINAVDFDVNLTGAFDISSPQILLNGGNVGIGTVTASDVLTIYADEFDTNVISIRDDLTNSKVEFGMNGRNGVFSLYDVTGNKDVSFEANSDNYALGKLGIGITNPGAYDDSADDLVVGGLTGPRGMTIMSGNTINDDANIYFADGTGTSERDMGRIKYSHYYNHMAIYTNDTEAVRLLSNGNLGVGTTSALDKLSSEGDFSVTLFGDRKMKVVQLTGQIYSDAGTTVSTPADVAEWNKVKGKLSQYELGTIVSQSDERLVVEVAGDKEKTYGVVTDRATFLGSLTEVDKAEFKDMSDGEIEEKFNAKKIGMVGHVKVKVDGEIKAGDRLVLSDKPGVAKVAKELEEKIFSFAIAREGNEAEENLIEARLL